MRDCDVAFPSLMRIWNFVKRSRENSIIMNIISIVYYLIYTYLNTQMYAHFFHSRRKNHDIYVEFSLHFLTMFFSALNFSSFSSNKQKIVSLISFIVLYYYRNIVSHFNENSTSHIGFYYIFGIALRKNTKNQRNWAPSLNS